MRKIPIENAQPGLILAKAVFTSEGKILLTAGITLNENFIERLKLNNIAEIYIEDETPKSVKVSKAISEKTRREAVLLVGNIIKNYNFENSANAERVTEIVNNIITELLANDEIIANLSELRNVDDYTFEHSVNVCVLSLITGIGLGYNIPRLKDLGVGAILHDIGKLKIPEEILKKPYQLTVEEFEEIKKHTVYGYEILKDNRNISMISAFIAFGHHERYDGSGYPLQLKSENIHKCARIVAVSDVYDALTSDRVYRKKLKPHEVIEYITSLGDNQFDRDIVQSFTRYISIYPQGTGVMLSNRSRGLVVKPNRGLPTRPVVKIIFDEDGARLLHHCEIDLSAQTDIHIVDACEID